MGYLPFVKKILSCICIRCSKSLIYKNENEIMDMLKNKSGRARLTEIRNLVKNVTYCQKTNYGCGAPVTKIRLEIKKMTGAITLYSETNLGNLPKEDGGAGSGSGIEGKRKNREILTPSIVYEILKGISDQDCLIMGLDPVKSRPEEMIHKFFPIPPVAVRPSVRADFMASSMMEDDLTHKLADIIKANDRIAQHSESENASKFSQDHLHLLQYQVASYLDSDTNIPKSEQKGKITKSLGPRLKGKEGRIRGNLMGKRVDYSARTVITSDPTIEINQLGVPVKIAMNLTFPEVVTPNNIHTLAKLVRNGRDIYPGANFVFPASALERGQRVLPLDLRFRKEKIELKYGDIVERHLMDGDIVLLNRQPTLHKQSMMGHAVKVINDPQLSTFRLSVAVTTPYNADFDGDEMNIFLPQSIQTQIELEEIADVKRQIITPSRSYTIIGIVQDGLIGAYNLTAPNMKIDWKNTMNMISYTSFDDFSSFEKKEYTGHEIFSMIIPSKINVNIGSNGDKKQVIIKNGIIEKGYMAKSLLGSKTRNNLPQLIWDEYGIEETKIFFNNTQRLTNNFNLYNGFTVGVADAEISNEVEMQINNLFQTKDLKIKYLVTELENNPDLMDKNLLEKTIFSELNVIREDVGKLMMSNILPNNNFNIMVLSGSKGSPTNLGQMGGCIGLQAFEGKLIPKRIDNRSLPYFHRDEDSSESRGLIKSPFIRGMTFPDFFFHNMTGREGIIDQAIKSVTGDTEIIVMEDGNIKTVKIGYWIDTKLDDVKNKSEVEHHVERDMELLKIKSNNKIYIPTSDYTGKVSWGEITAITRHDPGNELYEIKTKSGRKVIVTESKSLLIWNEKTKLFEMMSTPDVKIGNCVPVTETLNKPPVIISHLEISDRIKLNRDNGLFIGLYIAKGGIDINNRQIQISTNNKNIKDFVRHWFLKYDISNITESTDNIKGYSEIMSKLLFNIKNIPNEAFNAPDEFIIGLLDGYISENGIITDNSIRIESGSEQIIIGLSMLCSRIGIFGSISQYTLTIENQWIHKFSKNINLINERKNIKLRQINTEKRIRTQNNVILDEIVEINKIDVALYPKVYDLTVPSTLNFGLANGLHVVDTAESGYIQRKLVKLMEDYMVKYDGTVRSSLNQIIQFVYGDSGAETTRQYEYNLKILELNDMEIAEKHKFKPDELKMSKLTEKENDDFYMNLLNLRDQLRITQIKTRLDWITMNTCCQ
jgi:DNA-directed RNA polymerase beta' subunit